MLVLSPSSYRNTIFNQSTRVVSLECFLNIHVVSFSKSVKNRTYSTVNFTNLTCTLHYDLDEDSPKVPIESDGKETDQSPDSDQDVPSSISKLKRRLLNKSTPSRLPTPPTEQKKTPAAQTRKTPTDVLLTGKIYREVIIIMYSTSI